MQMVIAFASYGYDATGRAILTTHAGNASKTDLVFNSDESTTVTTANGSVTLENRGQWHCNERRWFPARRRRLLGSQQQLHLRCSRQLGQPR
jgi:hypothetical protein